MSRHSNDSRVDDAMCEATGARNTAPPGVARDFVDAGILALAEWQRFVATRAQKDFETWIRLIRCGSLAEAACVQLEASAELASDCLDAASRWPCLVPPPGEADRG